MIIETVTSPRLDVEAVRSGALTNVPGDHMVISHYRDGEWSTPAIQPYGTIALSPLALGLHYAQTVFEGMKAYRWQDGRVAIFRDTKHHERFNRSLTRMCMPTVPLEFFTKAMPALIDSDRDWVPPGPDSAYYIRPFVFASEERMGIKVSDEYIFMIVGGPFRPIYTRPLRVKVERDFVRAAAGGTGFAKCGGNYAAAMLPTKLAQQQGFDQVLWTDARDHHYIEESGTMNVCFIIDGALVTPATTDTILDGVTRDAVLTLAQDMGLRVEERPVTVDELRAGIPAGRVTEAFGVGTAASIAPIGAVSIDGDEFALDVQPGCTMFALKQRLNAVRFGEIPDSHHWMSIVDGVASQWK